MQQSGKEKITLTGWPASPSSPLSPGKPSKPCIGIEEGLSHDVLQWKVYKDLSLDGLFTEQLPYVQLDQALQGGRGHQGNHLYPENE